MGIELVLGLVIVASLAGLAYAAFNFFSVKKLPEGNERMQEIAGEIRLGANTFINYEYRVVAIVAVIIVVDEPTEGSKYGSVVAAPYVANVMERILPYLGVNAVYTEAEKGAMKLNIPDCLGWSAKEASLLLSEAGFSVSFVGTGDYVSAQVPTAGSSVIADGASVVLTLGETAQELLTVPDLVGMTASAANKLLIDSGFNIQVSGGRDYLKNQKNVATQYPAAGTQVPRGTVVTLRFPYDESSE